MKDEPIKVRRKTQQPFAMVPHSFARDGSLGDKAFRLWIVLQSHADYDDRDCKLFHSTLASEIRASRSTVWRAQGELVERGLLEIESGRFAGSPNVYVLVDKPTGVFHPRDTSYRTHATPGIAPTRDKENENQLNEKAPTALRPWKTPSVHEIPVPDDLSARIADLRTGLRSPSGDAPEHERTP